MPVMFVFHKMSGASGAGPSEKRVNDLSPWNCGHSYWSKLLSVVLPVVLDALTTFFPIREKAIKFDTIKNDNKMATTVSFFGIFMFNPPLFITKQP